VRAGVELQRQEPKPAALVRVELAVVMGAAEKLQWPALVRVSLAAAVLAGRLQEASAAM